MAASASVFLAESFILVISSSSAFATASVSYFCLMAAASPSALALSLRKLSLSSLVVTESLDVIELSSQGSLGLGQHVEVVLKISNNTEKFSILISNLVLGHSKVSKSQVGCIN